MLNYEKKFVILALIDFKIYIFMEIIFNFQDVSG